MGNMSFPNIPQNLRVPLFFADLDASAANTGQSNQRALVIGQITAAGTGVPNIPSLSRGASEAKQIGGQGSMLSSMVAAYRAADGFGEVWYLPLADDPAGTAATGSLTVTGAATATGTLYLYVAGVRVAVTATATMTAAAVATAIAAAINGNADLPVTAAVDATTTSKVNLTAKNKGAAAGDVDLRLNYLGVAGGESTPDGLAVTIVPFTGGGANPSLTAGLANLVDQEFDFIALPYTDTASLDQVKAFLNTKNGRWSWSKQIYGHAFSVYRGTFGNCATFGTGRNDEHVSVVGAYDSPTPAYVMAADLTGTAAGSLRTDPAVPLQTLAMSASLAPPLSSRFDLPSRNTLLYDGISTFTVDPDGTMRLENIITTYQRNGFGAPDDSYLEVETMATLTYVLRRLRSVVTTKFARVKLVSDDTRIVPGTRTVSPKIIKAALIAEYGAMEEDGYVQNSAVFAQGLIVQKNSNNPNRVDVLYPAVLIDQLRVFALLMQFSH